MKPFLTKETVYPWQEVFQAGIVGPVPSKEGRQWNFPILLLLPGASERKSKEDRLFLARNWNHRVMLPNTDEIREYVLTYYGPMDFNDIDKMNDWQKKYHRVE